MKKVFLVLLILTVSRIGVAYADSTAANAQDYFFGVKNASTNLNQVLALLVGPQGKPGPAGVAGKDGIIGRDGLPGAPGAVGATGKDGASVAVEVFAGSQGSCSNGGTKLTAGDGKVSYACNGVNGSGGGGGGGGSTVTVDAFTGAQGTCTAGGTKLTVDGVVNYVCNGTGGGTGGSLTFGQGEVTAGACETDGKVTIGFTKEFTGTDFVFKTFTLGDNVTGQGDITSACATKTVGIYMKIGAAPLKNTSGHYHTNDIIKCTKVLPSAAGWPATNPQFSFTSSDLTCVDQTTANSSVTFSEISTADFTTTIGFEVG